MLYWLVDFLNSQNEIAFVVHNSPTFRSSWFEHNTAIAYVFNYGLSKGFKGRIKQQLYNLRCVFHGVKPLILSPETDILYFPETFINQMVNSEYVPFKKWIVNQNAFFLLKQNFHALQKLRNSNEKSLGILNFSKLNEAYSSFLFGDISRQIHISAFVDDVFMADSDIPRNKKKQIAVMPRRGNIQLQGIKKMLQLKGIIEPNQWVEIKGRSQNEVKRILSESLIFLTFSEFEGLGLPVAEAMSMECIVLGTPAGGGEELFSANAEFQLTHDDWLTAVVKIKEIFDQFDSNPQFYAPITERNKNHILANYTKEAVEKNCINYINQLNFL